MATLRFRMRRTAASPPAFYEPTPYADRLTLADAFAEDKETRPNAEDRRVEHKPVGSCVEAVLEAVAPTRPASRVR
jgi:hypothetical protein